MRAVTHRHRLLLLAFGLVVWFPARSPGLEATLVAVSDQQATWLCRETPTWAPNTALQAVPSGSSWVVARIHRREVITRAAGPAAADLRLGAVVDLQPGSATGPLAPPTSPGRSGRGVITRLDGDQVTVSLNAPPRADQPATVQRDQVAAGSLEWLPGAGRERRGTWHAGALARPRLGDTVEYEVLAEEAPPPTAAPTPAAPLPRPTGQELVVAGDDPLLARFATLAARGAIVGAHRRQFDGEINGVYTRRQLVDFLLPTFRQLLDLEHRWPVQDLAPSTAGLLQDLVGTFRQELLERGVDLGAVDRALADRDPQRDPWLVTGTAIARLQSGDEDSAGRLQVAAQGSLADRLRFGATLGTEGGETLPSGRDRSGLAGYYLEYDWSRHLTMGVSRRPNRFGSGFYDLLWSDRAKPLDALTVDYHTKVFGRPFRFQEQTGLFRSLGTKYVTTQRFEYLPTRRLTLALNFGLITEKAGQALAALVLPPYVSRFVAGDAGAGGSGNFLGSFDASYRIDRNLAVYGQFFADDFDFSPSPPATAQRIGLLGGLHVTPARSLPGTSYRLEGVIIPDRGTYVGQQDIGLGWLRDGYLLGHPYGQDSAGVRFDGRHRLSRNWDVAVGLELYRQLRSYPLAPETTRFELSTNVDLSRWFTLGVGYRQRRSTNQGGVLGNNTQDNAFYVETRAGF